MQFERRIAYDFERNGYKLNCFPKQEMVRLLNYSINRLKGKAILKYNASLRKELALLNNMVYVLLKSDAK